MNTSVKVAVAVHNGKDYFWSMHRSDGRGPTVEFERYDEKDPHTPSAERLIEAWDRLNTLYPELIPIEGEGHRIRLDGC